MSHPTPGTAARTIVSLAPRYGVGSELERVAAHFTSHQDGLAAAAAELGHRFEVIGSAGADPTDPVGPVGAARARLAEGPVDLVLLYEGRLALLAPFAELATAHPSTRLLLNLFKSERHLDTPRSRGSRRADRARLRARRDRALAEVTAALSSLTIPENLVVTAETERRVLLARSLGLPVAGAWPLHSQLALGPPPPEPDRPGRPLRVLIQLQAHKVEDATLRELHDVVRSVARLGAGTSVLHWALAGRTDGGGRRVRLLRRLERLGVEVAGGGLDEGAYRDLHDSSDVVWLPVRGAYNAQSSGKALDALVRGVPVLAPAGSYGATEQSRWVAGAPSYGSTEEAIELVLRLPDLVPAWRSALRDRLDEVRRAYHPRTSVHRLLELSGPAAAGAGAVARP